MSIADRDLGDRRDLLKEFGVDMLTGEAERASGLGRILCDLTAQGKRLMESFLGGCVQFAEGSNWNPGAKDDPHVASVMATTALLDEFVLFALLESGRYGALVVGNECRKSWVRAEILLGFASADELNEWLCADVKDNVFEGYYDSNRHWLDASYSWRRISVNTGHPGQGCRNQHAMSGRVE